MPKQNSQAGQIGIIVLLITTIVLVIGLSIANRVVKENQLVVEQTDATRIFNVAETGVDEALSQIYQYELSDGEELAGLINITGDDLNQISIDPNPDFEGFVNNGETLTIDLEDGQTGNVDINWSKKTCDDGGGDLALSIYYLNQTSGNFENEHYLIGSCANANQNFIAPSVSSVSPYQFFYRFTLDAAHNQQALLRITPTDSGSEISVNADPNLTNTSQYTILSLASDQSNINKAIEVKKSIPTAPSFMDYALVSGDSISK